MQCLQNKLLTQLLVKGHWPASSLLSLLSQLLECSRAQSPFHPSVLPEQPHSAGQGPLTPSWLLLQFPTQRLAPPSGFPRSQGLSVSEA